MSNKLLPLRFSILKLLNDKVKGLNPYEVYDNLKDKYPNEKQCQTTTIDEHLMSMKGAGLLEEISSILDENNQIVTTYGLTDYGKTKVKQYIV